MMYTTSKRPLGANDSCKFTINVTTNSYAWVKYAVVVLLAVALRFLCCA